jgi:hypothetical protein
LQDPSAPQGIPSFMGPNINYGVHVLRRIFGPKRDEAIGGWRKLHNEELHNL